MADSMDSMTVPVRATVTATDHTTAMRNHLDLRKRYQELDDWRQHLERWRREEVFDRFAHPDKYEPNAYEDLVEMENKLLDEERDMLAVQTEMVRAAERKRLGSTESDRDYLRFDPPPIYTESPEERISPARLGDPQECDTHERGMENSDNEEGDDEESDNEDSHTELLRRVRTLLLLSRLTQPPPPLVPIP